MMLTIARQTLKTMLLLCFLIPLLTACGGGGSKQGVDDDPTLPPPISEGSFVVGVLSGNTSESGKTATFTIHLGNEPTADVTIALSSSNTAEGTVSPSILTFTTTSWATAQTVTVTGVDDLALDGNQVYTIILSIAVSLDPAYHGLDPDDVNVINEDNDSAKILVSEISGTTSETGESATFTVSLSSQPSADVTIGLSSDDATEGTPSPDTLTFTSDNWDTAQTVTVTGVDDDLADGDQSYTIVLSATTSADSRYNGLDPDDVVVINEDDEATGIVVSTLIGNTSEAGATVKFTVRLASEPTAEVNLTVASSDITEGTVSHSLLTFTADTWRTAQTVTVSGVDDYVQDGAQLYSIVLGTASSADPNYNGINPNDLALTNLDDDTVGIVVSKISNNTNENGASAVFTVVLTSEPTAGVTIEITSSNPAEGTVAPDSLTFTSSDWSTPHTVTITGIDDDQTDGNQLYTILLAAASSADPLYNGMDPEDVTVINIDNDAAGFNISPISGNTDESGTTATFTVELTVAPSAEVIIGLSSSDPSEGSVTPAELIFTSADWNIPQTVTVKGVADSITDGDQLFTIVLAPAVSTDINYDGQDPADVSVLNLDVVNTPPPVYSILVSAISGNTSEAGTSATFTVKLGSQPTADVTITLSSSNLAEGTVSPTILTLTTANWNSSQVVTVTGVDDFVLDGSQVYTIILAPASSPDPNFDGINPADVTVTNLDNETPGFTVGTISGNTNETGTTATFTVRLNTQPSANVTIGLSSSNTTEGTVSPSSLTFTAGNWNTNQLVTVTGVDDLVTDGNQTFLIQLAAAVSTDASYNGLDPNDVSVINVDNETPGYTVGTISGNTDEAGTTATFTVRLNTQPTADVAIALFSMNTAEGTVSPAALTFTAANWNTDQLVTVTGVDDSLADGNQTFLIQTSAALSTDINYNGLNPDDVSVINVDLVDPYYVTPKISAGNYHNLVLSNDGTVWGWGSNSYGQLDITPTGNDPVILPRQLNITRAKAIAAGQNDTAIVRADGTLWTCGTNERNQLGHHLDGGSQSALDQANLTGNVVMTSAGGYHIMALLDDGTVWGFGKNSAGQLGNGGSDSKSYAAVQAAGSLSGVTVTAIAAGQDHSLALDSTGLVHTWGLNNSGQLGDGNKPTNNLVPFQLAPTTLASITAIEAGGNYSLALQNDGTSWAWGDNSVSQLGTTAGDKSVPVGISGLGSGSGVLHLSGGSYHTLAQVGNSVYSWGDNDAETLNLDTYNNSGALGTGNTVDKTTATLTSQWGSAVIGISAGTNHSLTLNSDGTLKASGRNFTGQLGNNGIGLDLTSISANPITVEDSDGLTAFRAFRPVVSGYPSSSTSNSSINVAVACPAECAGHITHYQYNLDGGGFSGDIAITTPLALSGLGLGSHTVQIIARYDNGSYQLPANATSVTWTVTAP
ncbi:MAG: hypothetical protein KJ950_07375 [Proteobacteria bacterium]|nr:hypothetical protein [Pseudomonadota bacterium]MBU1687066.1 hypothetical protein [Pseudomonadota bacterium]